MLKLSRHEEFALITIHREEALNALSFDIIRSLGQLLEEANDWDIRALIFTGAGAKAFCAGADIEELWGRQMVDERRGARLGQLAFEKISKFRVPTVAAINGYAFGGGLELALACTFRLAAPTAKMGLPEIKLGLIPGYGGTQRLPRLVGEGVALDLILTGRSVAADEALRIGLVTRISQGNLLEDAVAFAREFSCHSLPVLELARDAVGRSLDVGLEEGLKMEADLSTLAYRTKDGQLGLRAFIDKTRPQFIDA